MKMVAALALALWIVLPAATATANAAEVPRCPAAKASPAFVPDSDDVTSHRQFALPVVSYPFGARPDELWGLDVALSVDPNGRLVCYELQSLFSLGNDPPLNTQRRALIAQIQNWHFAPFLKDGKPVAAKVTQHVAEQELPERPLPLPAAPLDQIDIQLERSGCFGQCPAYTVEIHGDGRVTYKGGGFVDVEGEHSYRIPTADVARLVDSLRAGDIWALRAAYRAGVTDCPTYSLTITVGSQTHRLQDYVGEWAGMPSAVSDFEKQVDQVAHTGMWVHLTLEGIDHLRAEHFDFHSPAGSELLKRASEDRYMRQHDEAIVSRLVELGAGARK